MSFSSFRIVQLWSEWCLYDILQDLMNRELEDEKVSVTIGKRTVFSTGCFPYCCNIFGIIWKKVKNFKRCTLFLGGCIYVSIILEIIVFVPFPFLKGVQFIIDPMSRWLIYDNLIYSKLATVLLVLITCIGTRAQKAIEFDARENGCLPDDWGNCNNCAKCIFL